MDINHLNGLILATLILVPGYLFAQAKSRLVIYEKPEIWQDKILFYIVHSLMLVGISLAMFVLSGTDIVSLAMKKNTAEVARALLSWPWIVTVFVIPVVFGFLSALFIRWNLVGHAFRLFGWVHGIRNFVPLPELTAWDSAFLKLNDGIEKILAVQLKSGAILYGEFDAQSFANRKGAYTDLFLTRALTLSNDGRLIPVPHTKGLFIRGSEISFIYLLEAEAAGNLDASILSQAHAEDSAHAQVTPRSTV